MLVILRLLAPAAAIVGTDRRRVHTLRRAGAASPGSAAHLGDPRPLRRWRIARLAGAGALRRNAEVEPAMLWFGDQPLIVPLALRVLRSMYSTADDLLQFIRALAGGALFAEPSTFDLMFQQWNRFGFPRGRRKRMTPRLYSIGQEGARSAARSRILTPLRPMPAVIGHTGSTGSWLFHCPDRGLLLAGTVDQATAGAVPFRFIPKVLRALESDR